MKQLDILYLIFISKVRTEDLGTCGGPLDAMNSLPCSYSLFNTRILPEGRQKGA